MRIVIVAVCALAACTPGGPECDSAVNDAMSCIQTYCAGNNSKLCGCVGQGLDVDPLCTCTTSLKDSFRAALCQDQTPGPFDCTSARARFADLGISSSCAGSCSTDAECGTFGHCVFGRCGSGCTLDPECGLDHICNSSSCVEGCRKDFDCYGKTSGDGFHRSICESQKCVIGCRDDSTCDIGNEDCQDGMCHAKSCQSDFDCVSNKCNLGHCKL